jgi:hypothetical protein
MNSRIHVFVSGKVQGVFSRSSTKDKADVDMRDFLLCSGLKTTESAMNLRYVDEHEKNNDNLSLSLSFSLKASEATSRAV